MAGAADAARSRALPLEASRSRALVLVPHAPALDGAPTRWQRARPPAIALGLTLLALGLHALVSSQAVSAVQSVPAGVALLLAGFGWAAWAAVELRRAGNALPSTARPAMLVDGGPYRFGRNPIYLGMVAMMLGIGIAAGVPLMAVAAVNFVAIVASVHIPQEEAMLKRAFGGWYSDYAASVRRWI